MSCGEHRISYKQGKFHYHFDAGGALCAAFNFKINGINADEDDFGRGGDCDPGNAEEYGCGDYQWQRKPSTPEVLKRYHITEARHKEITLEAAQKKTTFAKIVTTRCFSIKTQPPEAP